MKIAIFGAGGVGGYFGGLLARAGHEVTFVARGDNLSALRSKGLQVDSVNGRFAIAPVTATDRPDEVGPVDYVLVAVKHYHLTGAARSLRPLVGEQTTVIPLLNGVNAHETLIDAVGETPVVGGLCALVTRLAAPGVIVQESALRRLVVGELDGSTSERLQRFVEAVADTGAEAILHPDIHAAMWAKLLFIASFGGVSALARCTAGDILGTPATRRLFVDSTREVEAVARARGISLAPDICQSTLRFFEALEPTATSSLQRDVVEGRPFELEAFSGTIVRAGEEVGVPTPVHRTIYGLLAPALASAAASPC